MEAVGEVDARGTYTLDGALTAGAWLRMTTRLTPGEAARPFGLHGCCGPKPSPRCAPRWVRVRCLASTPR